MSITHIQFYPSDWLAGTRGLSAEETGVYITLICHMYDMAGPVERDDDRMHRLCGTGSKKTFQKVLDYLIGEGKITETDGYLCNERVLLEIEKITKVSEKARLAAEVRWKRKSNKNNGISMRLHTPSICSDDANHKPVTIKKVIDKSITQKNRGCRLPDDWFPKPEDEFLKPFNLTADQLQNHFQSFRDYWMAKPGKDGVKLDWQATWRNWIRNARQNYSKPNGKSTRAEIKQALYEAAMKGSSEDENGQAKGHRVTFDSILQSK